ncbi:MAG: hypothetical protein V4510_05405 [bacterium]
MSTGFRHALWVAGLVIAGCLGPGHPIPSPIAPADSAHFDGHGLVSVGPDGATIRFNGTGVAYVQLEAAAGDQDVRLIHELYAPTGLLDETTVNSGQANGTWPYFGSNATILFVSDQQGKPGVVPIYGFYRHIKANAIFLPEDRDFPIDRRNVGYYYGDGVWHTDLLGKSIIFATTVPGWSVRIGNGAAHVDITPSPLPLTIARQRWSTTPQADEPVTAVANYEWRVPVPSADPAYAVWTARATTDNCHLQDYQWRSSIGAPGEQPSDPYFEYSGYSCEHAGMGPRGYADHLDYPGTNGMPGASSQGAKELYVNVKVPYSVGDFEWRASAAIFPWPADFPE